MGLTKNSTLGITLGDEDDQSRNFCELKLKTTTEPVELRKKDYNPTEFYAESRISNVSNTNSLVSKRSVSASPFIPKIIRENDLTVKLGQIKPVHPFKR